MVVMGWLDSDKWCRLDEIKITRKHVESLMSNISKLHQSGYGHGDLRVTNIFVSKSDPERHMIVDFDWAGTLGVVHYPMNVNRAEIWRPDGVIDEDLIQAQHDLSMLEQML